MDFSSVFRVLLQTQCLQGLLTQFGLPTFKFSFFYGIAYIYAVPFPTQLLMEDVIVLLNLAHQEDLLTIVTETIMVLWAVGDVPRYLEIA